MKKRIDRPRLELYLTPLRWDLFPLLGIKKQRDCTEYYFNILFLSFLLTIWKKVDKDLQKDII